MGKTHYCPTCHAPIATGCDSDTEIIRTLRAQLAEAKQEILKRDSEIARVREDMRLRLRAKNDHTAELKAEIERLKDELTESESAHKEALIARLREERNLAREATWTLLDIQTRIINRSRAWKACAKRWRGIIRMWPKGMVSAPELEIKLKDLPSPTEDRSDQNEPNQEPDSTES